MRNDCKRDWVRVWREKQRKELAVVKKRQAGTTELFKDQVTYDSQKLLQSEGSPQRDDRRMFKHVCVSLTKTLRAFDR